MKENFHEVIKTKSDKELEIISKDYVFYSQEERYLALQELEARNGLSKELQISKKNIELEKEVEEDEQKPNHGIKFSDLLPQKKYLFTPVLIYANVFVFLLMLLFGVNLFAPSIEALVKWGGNIRVLTINAQEWRLFSSVFLHGGILHLLFNMYALLYVGSLLEKVIGKSKFIFAYLVCGIAASTSSLIINDNVVSVGASGAIFGLFGVLLMSVRSKKLTLPNISIEKLLLNVSVFVGYNIFVGFSKSGIDNAAHIGGLFCGIMIGMFYVLILKEKIRPIPTYIILTLALGAFTTLAITNISDKLGEYDRTMKEFAVNEQKALWMYQVNFDNLTDNQKEHYKNRLSKEGINIWEQNIALLETIKNNGYDYDRLLVKQIDMFIEYANLRKKSCNIMIELLETDTSEIYQKLTEIHIQIKSKTNEIREFIKENFN